MTSRPEPGDTVRLVVRGRPEVGAVTAVRDDDHRGSYLVVKTGRDLVRRWPEEVTRVD